MATGGHTAQQAAVHRDDVIHTRLLVAASFVCGVITSQRGPSILDLGDVSGSSLQQTVSLFSLGAMGQMVGCVATGLLLGRLTSTVFLFWVLVAMGASTMALPFCARYGSLATVYCLSLLCAGCVETASYADLAHRWGSKGASMVQLLQLWFVVGGVVSPGMTQFFLADRNQHASFHNVTSGPNDTAPWESERISDGPRSVSGPWNETDGGHDTDVRTSRVHMAYVISGSLSVLVAAPFLASFCLRQKGARAARAPLWQRDSQVTGHVQAGDSSTCVVLVAALFVLLVCGVQDSLQQVLFTFLVQHAHWSAPAAAWVTCWLWGGMLLVRVTAWCVPGQVADEAVVALSCGLLPVTLGGLHVSVLLGSVNGIWACVFFAGMAVSLLFPRSFTWLTATLATRTALLATVVMAASLLSGVANPLLLAHFLQQGRYLAFPLLLTSQALLALLLFLLLRVMARNLRTAWSDVSTTKSICVMQSRLEEGEDSDDVIEVQS
ncbi:sodium-dependent glucose transporter 1-like [Babylonia areolata]|uniref:sodium-dependent glucose transporter 1-like n=1 Tax=Babylonia areolata TaxID=304850 RepID=UPI003FD62553